MRKLFRLLQPYRPWLALIFILAVGQSSANLYLPNLMADIVNKGIAAFDTGYIWRTGLVMVLVAIGGTITAVLGSYFSAHVATGMIRTLREEIFTRVQQFSLNEFDTVSTASLITRTTNDTAQIQQVMVMLLNMVISAPITLVVGIILALDQDRALSWILVAVVPILVVVIVGLLINAVPLFTKMQQKLDKLNLILDENLTGVRVVRAFNRIAHEEQRFDEASRDVMQVSIRVNQLVAVMMPVMMLLINLTSVGVIWFGSHRVAAGELQTGAMFAFLQYAIQILFSLLMVAMMFIMIPRAEASASRINEVLAIKPEIIDPKKPVKTTQLKGWVEFKHVSFWYPGAEQPALTDISFTAAPGQVTAIIGGTGSGKSTLVNLIPRFFDVQQGQVLVDGIDVKALTQSSLRQRIGFVPQKAVLFSGTIAENIRYGNGQATQAEIEHAAGIAQAADFITAMPDGYETVMAQGGTNVSGGQKQRLSIARALVRQPEIYIFDDTFSALDFKTDAKLRAALKTETKTATVIIVAQRVSTVISADQIIVFDDGKAAGIGTHRELMRQSEVYRGIVSSQLSAAEIAEENG